MIDVLYFDLPHRYYVCVSVFVANFIIFFSSRCTLVELLLICMNDTYVTRCVDEFHNFMSFSVQVFRLTSIGYTIFTVSLLFFLGCGLCQFTNLFYAQNFFFCKFLLLFCFFFFLLSPRSGMQPFQVRIWFKHFFSFLSFSTFTK